MMHDLRRFTVEVMGHMSPTEWKTTSEIMTDIAISWKKQGRRKYIGAFFDLFAPWFSEEIVRRPGFGSMYVAFSELEAQGLAEFRWRPEGPEIIAKRRNLRLAERRLTEQGCRVKAKLAKTSTEGKEALVPRPA